MKFKLHPEYTAMSPTWQRYQNFYEGENETIKRYLRQFVIEQGEAGSDGAKAWAQRLNRTFYVNFCEPIISIWISLLFSRPADIKGIEAIFTPEELADIDGLGENNSLQVFIKDFTRHYLEFGRAFMFVDAPPVNSRSRAEDKATGWRPYGEIWSPLQVPDWERETTSGINRGKFSALHNMFIRIPPRADLTHAPIQQIVRRQLKFKDGVYTTQMFKGQKDASSDGKQANASILWSMGLAPDTEWVPLENEQVVQGLEEIPIAYLNDRSWIKEVQPLCERYYNLDSNHDNIIYFQGYARIAVAGNQQLAAVQSASEQSIMQFPEGTEITQITSEDPVASEKNRAELRNMIFRVGLNQIRQLDGGSQAVQSADTQREEKENTIALAEETVAEIQSAVNSFVRHWAAFKKKPDFEGTIELNKQFGTEDYEQFLALYSAFASQRTRYPETAKTLDKRLLRHLALSEKEETDSTGEIDAAKAEAPQQRQDVKDRLLTSIKQNGTTARG